ncbi:hypothetical protein AALM99_06475 [Lactococcus muris]|uniref:Uncharacterized protein n=1 Tax=Lactococcus muris TaxID=2941330 RepID=A0ABV4D8L4_9LACT
MKNKIIHCFLFALILIASIVYIVFSHYSVELKYIMLIFSLISTVISVGVSQLIFKFFLKVFSLFEENEWPVLLTTFYSYLLLNILFLFAIQNIFDDITIVSIFSPMLVIYLSGLVCFFKKKHPLRKIIGATTAFYLFNVLFSLVGVFMK